jgi:hypothetical protein
MVATARHPFPSIAFWQQPNFNPHNSTCPPCSLSRRACVILYMSLYFVEKKCVEAILVELVAASKWPHYFLNCYSRRDVGAPRFMGMAGQHFGGWSSARPKFLIKPSLSQSWASRSSALRLRFARRTRKKLKMGRFQKNFGSL